MLKCIKKNFMLNIMLYVVIRFEIIQEIDRAK